MNCRLFGNVFCCRFDLIEFYVIKESLNAFDVLSDDGVARHVDEGEVAGRGLVPVDVVPVEEEGRGSSGATRS